MKPIRSCRCSRSHALPTSFMMRISWMTAIFICSSLANWRLIANHVPLLSCALSTTANPPEIQQNRSPFIIVKSLENSTQFSTPFLQATLIFQQNSTRNGITFGDETAHNQPHFAHLDSRSDQWMCRGGRQRAIALSEEKLEPRVRTVYSHTVTLAHLYQVDGSSKEIWHRIRSKIPKKSYNFNRNSMNWNKGMWHLQEANRIKENMLHGQNTGKSTNFLAVYSEFIHYFSSQQFDGVFSFHFALSFRSIIPIDFKKMGKIKVTGRVSKVEAKFCFIQSDQGAIFCPLAAAIPKDQVNIYELLGEMI